MPDLTVILCAGFDHRSPTDGLRKFKECIYSCPCVETALEVSGTFDLIVQARFESLADYSTQMDRIAGQLRMFVTRIEANFVGRNIDRRQPTGEALWLPCEGGRKRVPIDAIDKVEAHGDYMKVYVGDWSCMVHDTIHHLVEQLDPKQFIQLHRSIVVRIEFIERMLHQNRRWTTRLRDQTLHRVARSHVPDILRVFASDSPTDGRAPATTGRINEKPAEPNEIRLHSVS